MSYILDALRRSQAERERGQLPGLNAQPAAVAALPASPEGLPRRWLVAGGLGVAAVLALFVALWRAPAVPAAPPAVVVASPAPPPQAVMPTNPAPLPIVVSAPPRPAPVLAAAPLPATGTSPPASPSIPPPASPTPTAAPAQTAAAAAAAAPAPPQGANSANPPGQRTVRLAELNAEQRRELPPLSMGGAVWSESALSRFVIINGQVVREGESAAPGVLVDRIGPKAVWLRWRELRLEVPI